MRIAILLSLLACAVSAMGQSLSTSVGSVLGFGQPLCQNNGTTHAACSGNWSGGDGAENAAGGGSANANYGTVVADAKGNINCSDACVLSVQTVSGSTVDDTANIQNAPPTGSFFLVTIAISGAVSNSNTNFPELQLNIDGNSAQCAVLTDQGSCHARLPVTGPTESFDFSLALVSSVGASLTGKGPGTDIEYADLTGRITELAVVDAKGHVLKNVVITTASGHQYPL